MRSKLILYHRLDTMAPDNLDTPWSPNWWNHPTFVGLLHCGFLPDRWTWSNIRAGFLLTFRFLDIFLFDLALFNKKKFGKFLFFKIYVIIMRTNPTTSRPGVSTIEEKKHRAYWSNYWTRAGYHFSRRQVALYLWCFDSQDVGTPDPYIRQYP